MSLPKTKEDISMNENTTNVNLSCLDFNVTGEERKRLVHAIGDYTEADEHYLGVPTCAYQVGCFTISRDGCVSFDSQTDSEVVEGLIRHLAEQGFVVQTSRLSGEAEPAETDNAPQEATEEDSVLWSDCAQESEEANTEADTAQEGETSEEGEGVGLTACLPLDDFDKYSIENLRKLVSAKGTLIRKALSADRLDINVGERELEFPWWDTMPEQDELQAYLDFITALSKMAQEAKRVTAREKDVENEKYAFRCFLIRLGFVGSEYKAQRKLLLRNLSGSSAFSSQEKAEAFNLAQKALRDAARAETEMEADPGAEAETEAGEG
jgi:hypothetical protein